MPFQKNQARPHYYLFAHRLLPAVLHRNLEPFRTAALAGSVDQGLSAMWQKASEDAGASQDAALSIMSIIHECGGRVVVLITPPPPEHVTEAHFIAVVFDRQNGSFLRYLVLEVGWDITTGGRRTVIGEWTRDSHVNFGDGPDPDAEKFLAVVFERFTHAPAIRAPGQ